MMILTPTKTQCLLTSKHPNRLVLIERKLRWVWAGVGRMYCLNQAHHQFLLISLSWSLPLFVFMLSVVTQFLWMLLVFGDLVWIVFLRLAFDNNYQILMVTFSIWLTCDALFWFIEFLFEITSSDQRAHSQHTTFCSTSHLLSIAQGCCSHNNTTERALRRRDFTFKSSRDRKSFQNVRDKKFYNWTDNILCRGRRLIPTQIQFQSALKQLHLNIKGPISSFDLSLVNRGPILVCHWPESSSGSISGHIPNCLLGQFESWNGTESLQSQTFFSIELRARC